MKNFILAALGAATIAMAGCKGTGLTPPVVIIVPKFAYVANQGSANVSGYGLDATTGALTPLAGSPFPAGTAPVGIAVARMQ